MNKLFNAKQLQEAFTKAENKTAEYYNCKTCSMLDNNGNESCPICYFRIWTKHYLGILNLDENLTESIHAHEQVREG